MLKAHEWFGYEWRLPLWSDELIEFWIKVPWESKIKQNLLIKYFEKYNPGGVFKDIKLPPYYPYFPSWAKFIKPLISIISKATGKSKNYYYQKYLMYFMIYRPLYPQKSYFEYIKTSQWHRHPVSYWVKDMLDKT